MAAAAAAAAAAVRIPGLGRVRRSLRRMKNRLSAGALILLYHRVIRLDRDPQWLTVSPKHFEEHLEVLRRGPWRTLPLRDLVEAFSFTRAKPPRRAIAVTFDDGYADNLINARPILAKRAVPATVYVTSGFVGRDEEFFWDELDRLLLEPGGQTGTLTVGAEAWDLPSVSAATGASWNVLEQTTPSARHGLYRALCARLSGLDQEDREHVLQQVRRWSRSGRAGRASHRCMNADEVAAIAREGLVEVGAHTVTHVRLAGLSPQRQREEIIGSKSKLEQILGRPVTTFSYPFGGAGDYDATTAGIVADAGFTCACENSGGSVRRGADRFRLHRVLVRDWDGDEFGRRLREWFDE